MDHTVGIMAGYSAYAILNIEVHEVQIRDGEDALVTSGEFGAMGCNIRFIR